MACEALHTGSRFLSASLASLDCHGRNIGSYGYGALSDPGSVTSTVLSGLLALFIALWGIRLLTGEELRSRDLTDAAIKIGLFLTLAMSWPAWRVIGYDLVLDGPTEVAKTVGVAAGLPGASNDLSARLQDADNAIVTLTMYGSGRLSGAVSRNADLGDSTMGVALPDQWTLGTARCLFLIATIGAFGFAKIGAALLLAIAPLMAGLLLFSGTNPIFIGWLRALAFCAAASLLFRVTAGAELAMIYPWISEVLELRQANVLAASAPTELLVLTGAYALTLAGGLAMLARMMFMPGITGWRPMLRQQRNPALNGQDGVPAMTVLPPRAESADRAAQVISAIENTVRRERPSLALQSPSSIERSNRAAGDTALSAAAAAPPPSRQGDRFRRAQMRTSQSARRRDQA